MPDTDNIQAVIKRLGKLEVQLANTQQENKTLQTTVAGLQLQLARQERELAGLRVKSLKDSERIKGIEEFFKMLPICSNCQKIRDKKGQWHSVADLIKDALDKLGFDTNFTHGICRKCAQKLYPELDLDDIA